MTASSGTGGDVSVDSTRVLAPRSGSPAYVINALCEALQLTEKDVFFDLGCNDGRLLLEVARRSKATCVGIELNMEAASLAAERIASRFKAKESECTSRCRIIHGDLQTVKISEATAVYAYLLPAGLAKLAPELRHQLRPGARVVSYMFRVPGWDDFLRNAVPATSGKPGKMEVSNVSKLFVYIVPG